MTKKAILEKITLVCALLVLGAGAWFWSEQIADVQETLSLAYPDE